MLILNGFSENDLRLIPLTPKALILIFFKQFKINTFEVVSSFIPAACGAPEGLQRPEGPPQPSAGPRKRAAQTF